MVKALLKPRAILIPNSTIIPKNKKIDVPIPLPNRSVPRSLRFNPRVQLKNGKIKKFGVRL